MKNIPIAIKFGTQSRSSLWIINMIFEMADLESLSRFGLKIAICLIFRKFGNQNKSNILIMNILIGIDYMEQKLEICEIWFQNWNELRFLWKLEFGQIWSEHRSLFRFLWNLDSKQIENAYYEYNTSHCLERSHDYMFSMIVGSEHGTIIRTNIVPITVPCSEWLYAVKFDSQLEHD